MSRLSGDAVPITILALHRKTGREPAGGKDGKSGNKTISIKNGYELREVSRGGLHSKSSAGDVSNARRE
jgi:hypothetical protein